MARLFTDGGETGNTGFWDVIGGSATVNTTAPRSGTYAYYLSDDGNNFFTKNIPDLSEFYLRFGFRRVNQQAIVFARIRNGTTNLLTMTMDTSQNKFYLSIGGNRSDTTISLNTYYLIELYYKISDSVGVITVKVDGVTQTSMSVSGDTKPDANTVANNITFGYGINAYFDDLALNDTSGSSDNSWCDDGMVIALTPNGNGDSSQWTGSDGNSTDNYALVDELPPSDTDYVTTSGSGNIDNYALTSYTLTGTESVRRIWTVARAKDTLSAGTLKLGLKTNSTNYTVTKSIGTSYGRVETSGYALNPNTSLAWTQSDLDSLQATIEMP